MTYREFAVRSKQVANALSGIGARPGDRVMTMLPRLVEWWEIVLGCIRGRFVSVPGTTLMTPRDIAYRVQAAGISVAITDAENLPKIEAARDQCPDLREIIVVGDDGGGCHDYEDLVSKASADLPNPNNPADELMMIYFTSGTTGYPKMVPITHSNYPIGHVVTGKFWMDQRPTDLHWTLSDTGWAQAAWFGLLRSVEPGIGPVHLGPARQVRAGHYLGGARKIPHHDVLRAPDGVPDARPRRPGELHAQGPAPLHGSGRTGEPRGHRHVARWDRLTTSGRRTDRRRPPSAPLPSPEWSIDPARWASLRRTTTWRSWTTDGTELPGR